MPEAKEDRSSRPIARIQQELAALQASSRIVTGPEELEELEHEIRRLPDQLAAALLAQKVQASLDSEEMSQAERELIKHHPHRLKSEGKKRSHCAHSVRK